LAHFLTGINFFFTRSAPVDIFSAQNKEERVTHIPTLNLRVKESSPMRVDMWITRSLFSYGFNVTSSIAPFALHAFGMRDP